MAFLSVASVRKACQWNEDEIVRLQAAGLISCNALQRREAEESLKKSHDDLERRIGARAADPAEAGRELVDEQVQTEI